MSSLYLKFCLDQYRTFNWVIWVFISSYLSFLHNLISLLSHVELVEKIFLHILGYPFVWKVVSFALKKIFSFMRSYLLDILVSVLIVVYSESLFKCLSVQCHSQLSLLSSSVYLVL